MGQDEGHHTDAKQREETEPPERKERRFQAGRVDGQRRRGIRE